MASGSAAIRRQGKRNAAWAIKWIDASGRQCWETLGREPAWNEAKAQRELGKRLQAVERDHWRKPEQTTFDDFARRFLRDYLPGRNLKPSTVIDYRGTIGLADEERGRPARHLSAFFGHMPLAKIEPADIDAYVAEKTATLAPKTIANHLGLLRLLFRVAKRWRLVTANPLDDVEPPRVEQQEMNVLTEAEIARLLTAYRELEQEADPDERPWWALARRLVEVALSTALRRGELLALRWRDVELLEGRLHVREAYVRGDFRTEEPIVAAADRTGPAHGRRAAGGLAGQPVPERRVADLLSSRSRHVRSTRASSHASTCGRR